MPAPSADRPSDNVRGPRRVILVLSESEEDEDWAKLSLQQFLRGYSEEDAICDKYDEHRAG